MKEKHKENAASNKVGAGVPASTKGRMRERLPLYVKILLGVFGVIVLTWASFSLVRYFTPMKIGVILNFSGEETLPYKQVLEWAKENSDRNIELVYVDSNGSTDITKTAEPLLNNRNIHVVIGPQNSDEALLLAPLFIEKKKLLISPTTTSADLYRAFAGQDYFWRTTESDVAQARTIIQLLFEKGTKKVALAYADTSYGKTFYDWIGFYATEKNMEVTSIQAIKVDADYDQLAANAATGDPDYIIVAGLPRNAIELKNRLDANGTRAKLFLTDFCEFDSLIQTLGERAEGLELTGPSTDPESGFAKAYADKFGQEPPTFMAPTYDAFMMAATTLARQEYVGKRSFSLASVKENVASSLKKVLFEEKGGHTYRWDQLKDMMDDIASGNIPTLQGATGITGFDKENGVDPTGTFYAYSIVKNGKFAIERLIPSGGGEVSAVDTVGSASQLDFALSSSANLPEKKDTQAVIVATTSQWQNYRHQSDAFAMYQLLRSQGVTDDKIQFFAVDDVANYSKNSPKPSLFHIKNGSNNYSSSAVDISRENVTAESLKQTLLNLQSDKNTNLFVYIAGHGGTGSSEGQQTNGDNLGTDGIIKFSQGDPLTAKELKATIEEMSAKQKFRQMIVVLETCFSGAMGKDITTPNVLFMTAASAQEVSYGANYNPKIKQWLADNFTYQFIEQIKKDPNISIADLYNNVYKHVPGSHVTLQNWKNFGALTATPISSFIAP